MSTPVAPGLVVAAPASGGGKTVTTLALLRAFRRRGLRVAAAKAGPDYIDPAFHAAASGRPSVNLDAYAMRPGFLADLAGEQASDADLLIVEGAMGLFDGAADGSGSTADLAAYLGLPVVLVVDAAKQAQSAAALVRGFRDHRDDVTIAGVVLNRVGSERHARMIEAALAFVEIPVLGAVPRNQTLDLPERHLGLVQAMEHGELEAFLDGAADLVAAHIDLHGLAALARPPLIAGAGEAPRLPPLGQRIAVATDEAFAFSYPHLLGGWRRLGAEILPFSPLADEGPADEADAVFLPGGYPELHAGRIAAAAGFRNAMHAAAARGALIYGECGGYMVLGDELTDTEGRSHFMLGLLPLETSFRERRLHLGYRRIFAFSGLPFSGDLVAHEFHYATVKAEGAAERLFFVRDVLGAVLPDMGLRIGRVMGSFAHVIDRL